MRGSSARSQKPPIRMSAPMPSFRRYVGIDYSGAATPTSSLRGLSVYAAKPDAPAAEVAPPPSARKHWTRRGIAEWLLERLDEDVPTMVGIDHGFSFPVAYFDAHGLPRDWPAFLDDFCLHWPTDGDDVYVDFVRWLAERQDGLRLGAGGFKLRADGRKVRLIGGDFRVDGVGTERPGSPAVRSGATRAGPDR